METISEKTDNELIAEFMGYDVYDDEIFDRPVRVFSIKTDDLVDRALSRHHVSQLQYDTSWNALMPVLEKIEQFKFDDGELDEGDEPDTAFLRTFKGGMVRINRFSLHHCETKIQAAHMAVVEFIRWYNATENPPTARQKHNAQ